MDNNKKINSLAELVNRIQDDPMSEFTICLYELEAVKAFFKIDKVGIDQLAMEGMYEILFNIIIRLETIGEELCKRI